MTRRKLIREIERRAGVVVASTPSCPFVIQHILGDIRRAQHQGGHRAH